MDVAHVTIPMEDSSELLSYLKIFPTASILTEDIPENVGNWAQCPEYPKDP